MKNGFRGVGAWLAIFVAVYVVYMLLSRAFTTDNTITYSQFVNAVKNEQVTEILINDKDVTATMKINGATVKGKVVLPSLEIFHDDLGDIINEQMAAGTLKQEVYENKISWNAITNIILIILIIAMFVFTFVRRGGGAAGGFTRSPARLGYSGPPVKFTDVAGAEEEKEELAEIVEFLKNPTKFMILGARIPKGVLLVGSPGTGKTLLARAVAGEAGVPFFSISGSDFVELYVGVGASRVRDLFDQAKRSSPCIVFIDEIDAVGRQRGTGMGGGHDEREQTLNQLLVEMDGFGKNSGVIVIAATNRPDILDPALLRPGRFDRQVVVDLPDVKGRRAILDVHSRKKPLAKDVDLDKLAKETVGYSGADLENLMNEASIFAARRGHSKIEAGDVDDANLKVMMGAEKKSKVVTDKEKRLTAYHEAGHAIVAQVVGENSQIHRVSIIPRGRAGGFTMYLPDEDKSFVSRNEILSNIMIMLGGRCAEELKLNDISTGASNDLERATSAARQMTSKYGMSENIGPVSYDSGGEIFIGRDFGHSREYSDETAAQIDKEIKHIIVGQYEKTKELLAKYDRQLEAVAQRLIEKETIDGDEFLECFNSASAEVLPEQDEKTESV